jgi:peptide/nickel transport system permease protein
VTQAVLERLPKTLELGAAALIISIGVALVVGTLAALRRNSALDLIATGFTIAGVSLPNFYLGIILILVFALVFRVFPPGGYADFATDPLDNLKRLVLPAVTLATASLAINLRQVRSSLLDVLTQDYLRTARAKGLGERVVILRHAMKNSLIPVVTIFGLQIGALLDGAIITETIFFWPGVGRLAVDSIGGRDYPVVQAIVLMSALAFMASTLAIDILYAWLDPRISYGRQRG